MPRSTKNSNMSSRGASAITLFNFILLASGSSPFTYFDAADVDGYAPADWGQVQSDRYAEEIVGAFMHAFGSNQCDQSTQSPITLSQVASTCTPNVGPMTDFKNGTCSWDDLDFKITPYGLRLDFPNNGCERPEKMVPSGGGVVTYEALSMSLKMPSEHFVDDTQSDGEITITYRSDSNELMFSSILIEAGQDNDDNAVLLPYLEKWMEIQDSTRGECLDGSGDQQLTTGFEGIGGSDTETKGIMFDVESKSDGDVFVVGFDINMEEKRINGVQVFTRFGTHEGHDTDPNGWMNLGEYAVEGSGQKKPTLLMLDEPIIIPPPGTRQAFYIVQINDDDLETYDKVAAGVGALHESDNNLAIFVGTSKLNEDDAFAMDKVEGIGFSGTVRYAVRGGSVNTPTPVVEATPAPVSMLSPTPDGMMEISTGFEGTKSRDEAAGIMFDVECISDMNCVIEAIDLNIEKEKQRTVEVFSRLGTHEGHETNMNDWDSGVIYTLEGQGQHVPTRLPLTNPLSIPSKERRALYIAQLQADDIETYDKQSVGVNALHQSDGSLAIYVGASHEEERPFASDFVQGVGFSGSLLYRTSNDEPDPSPSPPNPAPAPTTVSDIQRSHLSTGFLDIGGSDTETQGIMLDIVGKRDNLYIEALDINVEKERINDIQVFTRLGSHVGHEDIPADWTDLGVYQVQGMGSRKATRLTLNQVIELSAGERKAFYIVQRNADDIETFDKKDAGLNALHQADDSIEIYVGTSKLGEPFEPDNEAGIGFSGSFLYARYENDSRALSLASNSNRHLVTSSPVNMYSLYTSLGFYQYTGSMTMPPCENGIRWYVLDVALKISISQKEVINKMIHYYRDDECRFATLGNIDEMGNVDLARPLKTLTSGHQLIYCNEDDFTSITSPTSAPVASDTEQPTTESPTEAPTETPTTDSSSPTSSPVASDTEQPTTESPTEAPTETPTTDSSSPTSAPVASDTEQPTTESPTDAPTETPTEEPTEIPTEAPTETPTEEPTETPTESPDSSSSLDDLAPIHFYCIGDVPYEHEEKKKLEDELTEHLPDHNLGYEEDDDVPFIGHVGDLNRASNSECRPEWFVETAQILTMSPIPVMAVPGDNEWMDCPPHFFLDYFMRPKDSDIFKHCDDLEHCERDPGNEAFFEDFWGNPLGVERREDRREENFSFTMGNVLFLGLNMLGFDSDVRDQMLEENLEFVTEKIEAASDTEYLVVFAHKQPAKSRFTDFMDGPDGDNGFRKLIEDRNIEVLWLHGNGHNLECEQGPDVPDGGPFNLMTRVQVDRGDDYSPLKVTVYRDRNNRKYDESAFVLDRGDVDSDDEYDCKVLTGACKCKKGL